MAQQGNSASEVGVTKVTVERRGQIVLIGINRRPIKKWWLLTFLQADVRISSLRLSWFIYNQHNYVYEKK